MNLIGDLVITDTVSDFATAPELYGAHSIAMATINGQVYVYVSAGFDDGIQVLSLDSNGELTPVTSVTDTSSTALNGVRRLTVVEKAGKSFLVAAGNHDDGVTVFEIDSSGADAGHLTLRDTIYNGSSLSLDGTYDVESYVSGNRSFVVVSAAGSDAVSIFELGNSGDLTKVEEVTNSDNVNYQLDGVYATSIHTIGNKTYLYTVASGERGISVFEINSGGQLTFVSSITGLNGNSGAYVDILAGTFQGDDYLIVPDYSNGHFLVYSLGANGVPTLVHNFDAYAASGNQVYQNYFVDIIEIDGVSFIISQSDQRDRFDVYTLDDSGTMSFVESIVSSDLNGAVDIEHAVVDGKHFVVVTAQDNNGVTVIEIGGGDEVIKGTAENDRIVGLGGDDDLIGLGGNDLLLGGDGDDVLSGRKGNDKLFGGNGEDVLIGGVGNDVLNGGAGRDFLLGGAGSDSLSYEDSDAGVRINLATGSATGGHATDDFFTDIENIIGSDFRDTLTGDNGANVISGGGGNDVIDGGGDKDTINGGAGNDTVDGGAGNDRLSLDDGHDTAFGGTGADRLLGGKGKDVLNGGVGNDRLSGNQGNDRLIGDVGNDTLTGGGGNDVFVFGDAFGSDTVRDFKTGSDRVDLSGNSNLNSYADVQANSFEFGGNTVIADGSSSIQLVGVELADLSAGDFLF